MNPLSPGLLNMLANKGIVPPQGGAPPDPGMLQAGTTTITGTPMGLQPVMKPADIHPGGDISPAPEPGPIAPTNLQDRLSFLNPMGVDPVAAETGILDPRRRPVEEPSAPKEEKIVKPEDQIKAKPETGAASMQGGEGAFKLPAVGGPSGTAWVDTVSPKVRGLYEKALAEGKTADQAQVEAEQGANEAKADTELTQGAAAHAEAEKMQAAEQHRAKALGAQEAEIREATKLAESGKIDPEHFWHSRTDAQKVLGTVALFLHGLSGDRGPSMIERMADKDIDAQKANIANNWHSVEAKNSLLGRMMQRFGDERTAEEAARAVTFKQYALVAQSEATRSQSPILLAKAQQLNAASDMKNAEFQRNAQKQVATGGGGLNLQAINKAVLEERSKRIAAGEPWDQAIEAKTRASIASAMGGTSVGAPAVPGMQQKASNLAGAGRLAKPMVALESNVHMLDELGKISQGATGGFLSPADIARAKQLTEQLKVEGVSGLPEGGVVGRWTGSEIAGIRQAREAQQKKLEVARRFVASGGAGGGNEGENPDDVSKGGD